MGSVPKMLAALLGKVQAGAKDDLEVGANWVRWVQSQKLESCNPPMHSQEEMVQHPLTLLKLGSMQCGQSARLLADGLLSIGFPARLVFFGSHVAAEAYLGGSWRLLEASILGGGDLPIDSSGEWVGATGALELASVPTFAPYREQMGRKCKNYSNLNSEDFDPLGTWVQTVAVPRRTATKVGFGGRFTWDYGWNLLKIEEYR